MRCPFTALQTVDLCDKYAWSLVTAQVPYLWGGDTPLSGLDCSGSVIWILQGVGLFPHGQDANADSLMRKYTRVTEPLRGCLACFGDATKGVATHIAWVTAVVDESVYILEAGGGGSKDLTRADAIRDHAEMRMRKVGGPGCRTDLLCYVDPFV